MKAETEAWVAKAEGDFRTAERELSVLELPNYDAVCFHAQQCAEKYPKALLVEAGVPFPKIHDLAALLQLVLQSEPSWVFLEKNLNALTSMGAEVRYPGVVADIEDANEAFRMVTQVREALRAKLMPKQE